MVRLTLNMMGLWEVGQLFPSLPYIVRMCPEHFGGQSGAKSRGLNGAATETEADSCRSPVDPTSSGSFFVLFLLFLSQ